MNPKIWFALEKLGFLKNHTEVFKVFIGYESGKATISVYPTPPLTQEEISLKAVKYNISIEALCNIIGFFTGEVFTPGVNATDLFDYQTHRKIVMCQLVLDDCLLYINFEDDRIEENTSKIAEENLRKTFKVGRPGFVNNCEN